MSTPLHISYMAIRERLGCYNRAAEYREGRRRLGGKQRVTLLTSHSVAVHFGRLRAMRRRATVPAVSQ